SSDLGRNIHDGFLQASDGIEFGLYFLLQPHYQFIIMCLCWSEMTEIRLVIAIHINGKHLSYANGHFPSAMFLYQRQHEVETACGATTGIDVGIVRYHRIPKKFNFRKTGDKFVGRVYMCGGLPAVE